MKNILCIGILSIPWLSVSAQNQINFSIKDASTDEVLIGVNIYSNSLDKGAVTDLDGMATFKDIPNGTYSFTITYLGYQSENINLSVPNSEGTVNVMLKQDAMALDEVIVSANRANRSIANTPSRIEVLTDEVEEAATMDPSKIAHLLMHTTGVQVQQTSATSGSASVRIQGQYGRYTQILKDGFPIYGGFTGGLGVFQIPPLDLKQVEFVKGSSSTLYGGGAIAGLINLVSKEPKEEDPCFLLKFLLSFVLFSQLLFHFDMFLLLL